MKRRGDDLCNFFVRLLYSDNHLCYLNPLKTSRKEVQTRIEDFLNIWNSSDSNVSTVILNAETKAAEAAAKEANAAKKAKGAAKATAKAAAMAAAKEAEAYKVFQIRGKLFLTFSFKKKN